MAYSASLPFTIYVVLWLIWSLMEPVGLISFSDNSCEAPGVGGSVQYRACLSDPLAVLSPTVALYTLTVSPPNATCGIGSRQLSCTLVRRRLIHPALQSRTYKLNNYVLTRMSIC